MMFFNHLNTYCFLISTTIMHHIIRITLCMMSCNLLFVYQYPILHSIDDVNVGVGLLLHDLTAVTSQPHLN